MTLCVDSGRRNIRNSGRVSSHLLTSGSCWKTRRPVQRIFERPLSFYRWQVRANVNSCPMLVATPPTTVVLFTLDNLVHGAPFKSAFLSK
jgi:hypothetical protein